MLGRLALVVFGTVAAKAIGKQLAPEKEKAKDALKKAQNKYSENMDSVNKKQEELNLEKKRAKKGALFKSVKEGFKSFVLDGKETIEQPPEIPKDSE